MSDRAETWHIELRVPIVPGEPLPGRRLAQLLKRLGRAYGVRCVRLLPAPMPDLAARPPNEDGKPAGAAAR